MDRETRLQTAPNIWLATARPNGRPHLIPVWFLWLNGNFYFCTAMRSVKARNLMANPRASVALEDGNQPVIAECAARLVARPYSDELIRGFKEKYDWDVRKTSQYDSMFELQPYKWLMSS